MIFSSLIIFFLQFWNVFTLPINGEDPWQKLDSGKCFLRVTDKKNWSNANTYCRSKNARLVSPFLLQHEVFLKSIFANTRVNYDIFWTSLTRSSSKWSWNVKESENQLIPNVNTNFDFTRNCASVKQVSINSKLTLQYYADNCGELKEFFCERVCDSCENPSKLGFVQRPKTSNWYFKIDEQVTWADALKYCELFDSSLPCIHDQKENDHVQEITRTSIYAMTGYWLGGYLNQNRVWTWLDKQPFCYDYWSTNEPNNVNNREGYINIWSNQGPIHNKIRVFGRWNDDSNTTRYGIICQTTCGPLPNYEYSLDLCPQSTFNPFSSSTTQKPFTVESTTSLVTKETTFEVTKETTTLVTKEIIKEIEPETNKDTKQEENVNNKSVEIETKTNDIENDDKINENEITNQDVIEDLNDKKNEVSSESSSESDSDECVCETLNKTEKPKEVHSIEDEDEKSTKPVKVIYKCPNEDHHKKK